MWHKIRVFFELIKFEHTVFALPFAYLGMLSAARGWPRFWVFFWITLAMVSARTAGMTLNRLIDRKIDEKNPRTKNRPTVTGEFPLPWAWGTAAAAVLIFFFSAYSLNPLCFKLSGFALFLLAGYHYVKRFSFLCHWALGTALAMAPMGGWLAVTGRFSWVPVPLALAVLFWVAGFDVIYSLQDMDFDRAHGLHSVPARFGQRTALRVSAGCHAATVVFLALFALWAGLGVVYWAGVGVAAALLWIEHRLVSGGSLANINAAFFTINGWIGILLLIFTFLDIYRG